MFTNKADNPRCSFRVLVMVIVMLVANKISSCICKTDTSVLTAAMPLSCLNLHSHDLRVPVGSLSRFKLSLPQCDVPGVLNCLSGRSSGFPSLY